MEDARREDLSRFTIGGEPMMTGKSRMVAEHGRIGFGLSEGVALETLHQFS